MLCAPPLSVIGQRGFLMRGIAVLWIWLVLFLPMAARAESDEIVVTATRRVEALKDVPMSVTAIGAMRLQDNQITSLSGLQGFAPNLWVPPSTEAGQTYFTIRGIGPGIARSSGRGVGVYLDGFAISADTAMDAGLLDVGQVEVLRGPQGTLFGRNTIGGAVRIKTRPVGDQPSASSMLELGNFSDRKLRVSADIPLSDRFAVRLSGQAWTRDGHIHNATTGADVDNRNRYAVMGQARWKVTPDTQVNLLALHDARDELPNTMGEAVSGLNSDQTPDTINWDQEEKQQLTETRLGLKVDHDFANGDNLQILTGWGRVQSHYIQDSDRLPQSITVNAFDDETEEFSAEARYLHEFAQGSDLLLGAYALRVERDFAPTFPVMGRAFLEDVFFLPPAQVPTDQLDGQNISTKTMSLALYAHTNVRLNENWSLFGGVRATHEEMQLDYHIFGEVFTLFGLPELRVQTNVESTPLSWTFGAKRKLGDNAQAYATISRGFRSPSVKDDFVGQADLDAATGFFTKPEFVTSYEAGLKGDWWQGRLQTQISAYYMHYSDIQVSVSRPPFTFLRELTNAASAHVQGAEMEAQLRPLDGLVLYGSLGLTHSEYDEFTPSPGVDYAGLGFGNAPAITFAVSADYGVDVGQGRLNLHLDRTAFIAPTHAVPMDTRFVGDHAIWNGLVRFTPQDSAWQIELWGKNLMDNREPVAAMLWGAGLGPLIENETYRYQFPRTFGVRMKVEG